MTISVEAFLRHPRDIVLHVCDPARHERREPSLDERWLDDSCRAYFLDEG
ncbi:MAG TPA: hypothetical protein VFG78_13785 [Gemmatimonadota bacterium]|nr:hypothetical protein [Gemmatimonadota bacterium]